MTAVHQVHLDPSLTELIDAVNHDHIDIMDNDYPTVQELQLTMMQQGLKIFFNIKENISTLF